MVKSLCISAVVTATISGCAQIPTVERNELLDLGERIARSICAASIPRVEEIPNQHDRAVIDRIESRSCAAGSSQIYFPTESKDSSGFVLTASVISPRAGLPRFIEINSPFANALRTLGAPDSEDADSILYELNPETPNTMKIGKSNGLVSSVTWFFYLD